MWHSFLILFDFVNFLFLIGSWYLAHFLRNFFFLVRCILHPLRNKTRRELSRILFFHAILRTSLVTYVFLTEVWRMHSDHYYLPLVHIARVARFLVNGFFMAHKKTEALMKEYGCTGPLIFLCKYYLSMDAARSPCCWLYCEYVIQKNIWKHKLLMTFRTDI